MTRFISQESQTPFSGSSSVSNFEVSAEVGLNTTNFDISPQTASFSHRQRQRNSKEDTILPGVGRGAKKPSSGVPLFNSEPQAILENIHAMAIESEHVADSPPSETDEFEPILVTPPTEDEVRNLNPSWFVQ